MLTSRRNNTNTTRLPSILPNLGDTSSRQQQQQISHRPVSNTSIQSIDNAYSLEHLFTALHRRIRRTVQTYKVSLFHEALKICARVFQSYASYNLNTIDEFARRLGKTPRDNKKVLILIDQFRSQLSELRHCHSTFEAELLVTTLVIDFHENDLEQQINLSSSNGKFSPRSRLSKFLNKHIKQAIELKSQLRQANEHLQILLYDEFNANTSDLWEESEKYISPSIPFHDHHMTYILRLIPDIAFKFTYALQLCTKLFELETVMLESYPQINNNKNASETTPVSMMTFTPRSDYNQKQNQPQAIIQQDNHQYMKSNREIPRTSAFFSTDITTVPSNNKLPDIIESPASARNYIQPLDTTNQHNNTIQSSLYLLPETKPINDKNDEIKLQLLLEQLDRRLHDENSYRKNLLNCIQRTEKKYEQLNHYFKSNMLTLVMSNNPAAVEYQKALCSSDCQIYKSIEDELNIALKETQYRIDWIEMVRTRAHQCLNQS
ncbi:unnamed protein product [Adineta steineri]|uniref:Uncharacterized protein n=1 Tax=Adineta steineri TaxID=433720 RepID=A0A818M632_9BILA|nr:unnamed protein product [Adineta steineri]